MLSRLTLFKAGTARPPTTIRPPTAMLRAAFPRRQLPTPSAIRAPRPFSTTSRLHPPKRPKGYEPYDRSRFGDVRTKYQKIHDAKPLFTAESAREFFRKSSTRSALALLALAAAVIIYNGIETVPVSGRTRLNIFPRAVVEWLTEQETEMLINQLQSGHGPGLLPEWDPRVKTVRRAVERLLKAAGLDQEESQWERMSRQEYVWGVSPERQNQQQYTSKASSKWRVFVIDDPTTANAFVVPGGAVFVYSGILPIAKNEDGLAAVLGHEIAHDVASHHGEGMTRSLGVKVLLYTLVAATAYLDGGYITSWLGGSALGLLFQRPHDRRMETEADHLGLMMMAGACYDPREAWKFWKRMDEEERKSGQSVPEFMSTHPSSKNRMDALAKLLPEAERKWQDSDCAQIHDFTLGFAKAFGFNPRRGYGEF